MLMELIQKMNADVAILVIKAICSEVGDYDGKELLEAEAEWTDKETIKVETPWWGDNIIIRIKGFTVEAFQAEAYKLELDRIAQNA